MVVNHLRPREPLREATLAALRDGVRLVTEAGELGARVAQVDDTHLILLLEFSSAEDANWIAREVGGQWMREHISPLLADGTERYVAEVIATDGA